MSKKRDVSIDFSDRLREAALHKGLSGPTDIGKYLGVNKQTVFNWMQGSVPRGDEIFQIAEKFGVDPRWFATGQRAKRDGVDAIEKIDIAQKWLVLTKLFWDASDERKLEIVEGALAVTSVDGARFAGGRGLKRR